MNPICQQCHAPTKAGTGGEINGRRLCAKCMERALNRLPGVKVTAKKGTKEPFVITPTHKLIAGVVGFVLVALLFMHFMKGKDTKPINAPPSATTSAPTQEDPK